MLTQASLVTPKHIETFICYSPNEYVRAAYMQSSSTGLRKQCSHTPKANLTPGLTPICRKGVQKQPRLVNAWHGNRFASSPERFLRASQSFFLGNTCKDIMMPIEKGFPMTSIAINTWCNAFNDAIPSPPSSTNHHFDWMVDSGFWCICSNTGGATRATNFQPRRR